jgi:hypothetical protein
LEPHEYHCRAKTDAGQLVGLMTVPPKDFKTGSKGYFTSGKVEMEGKRYQVQVQAGGDWQQDGG